MRGYKWRLRPAGKSDFPEEQFRGEGQTYTRVVALTRAGETVRVERWDSIGQRWEWYETVAP